MNLETVASLVRLRAADGLFGLRAIAPGEVLMTLMAGYKSCSSSRS